MTLSQNISDYILRNFGREYLENYLTYIQSSSNTYIRLSPFFNSDETIQSLKNYGVQLKQVENIHFAYQVIEGSHLIGKTLDFILGKYYIQSLSSMIPAMILNPSSNDKTRQDPPRSESAPEKTEQKKAPPQKKGLKIKKHLDASQNQKS